MQSTDGKVVLTVPAGAVSGDVKISVAPASEPTGNEHVAKSSVYEFGPSGTQFAQPVTLRLGYDAASLPPGAAHSSLRLVKLIDGAWKEVGEGLAVDSASRTVSARIRSFSTYGVKSDPCVPGVLGATLEGQISRNDCLYEAISRRSDYYNFSVAAPAMYRVRVSPGAGSSLTGLFGVKDANNTDPTAGLVWGFSSSMDRTLWVGLRPGQYQVFISGQDTTKTGAYTLTSSASGSAPTLSCGDVAALQPGTGNEATLTTASCEITITTSPVPEFVGEKTRADYYAVKVEAGKTYDFAAEIRTPGTNIALAMIAGGQIRKLDASGADVGTKSFSFTAQSGGWIYLEVSASSTSGTTWNAPLGSYRITVGQEG